MAIYMQYPGTQGDISAKNYENWIEVFSLHHGLDRNIKPTIAGRGNDRDRGVGSFHSAEIVKPIDSSSAKIYSDCCTAKAVDAVKFCVIHSADSPKTFLEYTLFNVLVAGVSKYINSEKPHEIIHFSFSKIQERFTPTNSSHKASNPISIGYNAETAETM